MLCLSIGNLMKQLFRANAIVLHEILNGKPGEFEDIELVKFETILNHGLPCLSAPMSFESRKPSLLITFDDGHKSDVEIVLPLLLEHNATASFFIVPDFIGEEGFLSWQDVKELSNAGMDIGSHSLSHTNFRTIDNNQILSDLVESKRILEDKIGKPVVSFSFPYGFVPRRGLHLASASGYSHVFGSKHGIITSRKNLKEILPRNSINTLMSSKKITKILEASVSIRCWWVLEDNVKQFLKFILPQKVYFRLRSLIR